MTLVEQNTVWGSNEALSWGMYVHFIVLNMMLLCEINLQINYYFNNHFSFDEGWSCVRWMTKQMTEDKHVVVWVKICGH